MRSSVTSNLVVVAFAAGLSAAVGCSGDGGGTNPDPFTNATAAMAGAGVGVSGNTGTSGNTGASGAGVGGAGTAGSPAAGGTPGGGSPGVGGTPIGGSAGSGGDGGGGGPGNKITDVWPSDGHGKAYAGPSGNMDLTISISGTKDPDCAARLGNGTKVCGAYTLNRVFRILLPPAYDPMVSYPMLFEGPGCGGGAGSLYGLPQTLTSQIIRIGLQPSRIEAHGTNPNQGCFDDKEGDDSNDWPFYEALYDKFNAELSFDRNRVFVGGNSSGAWLANEMGCKYAGDAMRPIRGIMPNTGGLPTDPAHVPTCTNNGMAGMWVHEVNDGTNPFSGNIVAIDRAMKVNMCTQSAYNQAQFENFPIGGGQADDRCKRILNCDPLFPLVVCALPGSGHGSHPETVNPGWEKFMGLFNMPPLK